ncbi:hypothetical protein DV736_g697, partial [Chaetothyriales sp. CBS 134916]
MSSIEQMPVLIPAYYLNEPPLVDDIVTETSDLQQETIDECLPLLGAALDASEDPSDFNAFGVPELRKAEHIAFLENNLATFPAHFDFIFLEKTVRKTFFPLQNSTGGFGGGYGHYSHLAGTYAALLSIALVGGEDTYAMIDRKAMWHWLGRLKQCDGGFQICQGGEEDVRGALCALVIVSLLDLPLELPPDAPSRSAGFSTFNDGLGDFIARCQTYEGGISASPGLEAHGAYAFCSIACLCLLGDPHATLFQYLDVPALLAWLSSRQYAPEGGIAGRTNKVVDGCYSHWVAARTTARELNQQSVDYQLAGYDAIVAEQQDKQQKKPWHRDSADEAPGQERRSAEAMTKGKLVTTPSRLLKLVMPLTMVDCNSDRKDIAPLALLIHPQQPLSYLERLVQAELPTITNEKGDSRIPSVTFRAIEACNDEMPPEKKAEAHIRDDDGGKDKAQFVKWSASTEIGDFIRDAARAREFEIEIEGTPGVIKVAVPSFNDRTFYLRQRLRGISSKISDMAKIKQECDETAHKTAQRIAVSGCGVLVAYWYLVYCLTFETDLGWDAIEPVTYLVGLSTLIGGYMWFLWHNREVSYRQAMQITISRRQSRMYELKGLDLHKWETLLEEANAIRREIKSVASEYDVEWDEREDEGDKANEDEKNDTD